MKKEKYIKPATQVTKLQYQLSPLCTSHIDKVSTNLGESDQITLSKEGSSQSARGRQYDCWGEEEEEY